MNQMRVLTWSIVTVMELVLTMMTSTSKRLQLYLNKRPVEIKEPPFNKRPVDFSSSRSEPDVDLCERWRGCRLSLIGAHTEETGCRRPQPFMQS